MSLSPGCLYFILQDECTVVSSPVTSRTPHNESFSYSVKVINPSKKTDYSLRKFRVSVRFVTMGDVMKALAKSFPTFITKESCWRAPLYDMVPMDILFCLHFLYFTFNPNTTMQFVVFCLLPRYLYPVIIQLSCAGRLFHFHSVITVVLDSGG